MTETWKKYQFKKVDLKTCYRQKDNVFIEVLHKMHLGGGGVNITKRQEDYQFTIVYTAPLHIPRLYFTNRECNDYNKYRLKGINAALHEFKSVDYNIEGYDFQLVTLLKVKVGAVVMLRKNLTDELCNGRIGTITKIQPEVIHVLFDDKEIPIERYNEEHHGADNEVLARRRNFPLILSFVIIVHKSQGCTFDELIVCSSREFAWGQLYVSVSRCKNLKGLHITKNRVFKYRSSYNIKRFNKI